MADLYELLEPEVADEIQQLTWLSYDLRENRKAILDTHGAADEAALLEKIQDGALGEHPAYEHYLAARILADTREAARALIAQRLEEHNK